MSSVKPSLAVIGGTGLNRGFGEAVNEITLPYTPYGEPSANLGIFKSEANIPFAFLPRHGSPHQIPPHKINYRANIWALKQQGISQVIAVNAVGGIPASMGAGVMVVPDQLVDYTHGREHTFSDGSEHSTLEHIDFTHPFSAQLRGAILSAASTLGVSVYDGGVYGVVQGPRLETAAEINRMETDGCDLVGMTAMPEAALARELGMAYASLCLVVNPAAGRSDKAITMDDIGRVLEQGMSQVQALLLTASDILAQS